MSVRAATTVLLLKPGADGPEVFMVQRHRRSGFLPNAWVFPGGRVDPADAVAHPRITPSARLTSHLGLDADQAYAYAVAGVRETFEEAGIWLGTGHLEAHERLPMQRGERSLVEVVAAAEAHLDLDRLTGWSWWVTPAAEPKRYDTRFLVAAVDDVRGSHDTHETVASRWVSPRQVLRDADQTGFPLAPPTWWTLWELARYATPQDAVDAARARPLPPIQPVMQFEDSGIRLLLPGHPDHPEAAVDGLPDRITFDSTWVAWRGAERFSALP